MNTAGGEVLRLGIGKADITPRVGVGLAGFGPYLNRNSTGVLSPLFGRCMVLSTGDTRVAILSLELCGLCRELVSSILDRIGKETGLPAGSVFISCTHTHSGPQTTGHTGWGHPDDLYLETLPGRVVPAVQEALASAEPVQVAHARPACEGIAINRERDAAYDRSQPAELRLDPAWRPARPELTDPVCRMLIFKGPTGIRGILHNFACHPVVCCEACTQIHGDFVGLASARFESTHPGSLAVFLPGALGDVNPSVSHRPEEVSLRALDWISARYATVLQTGLAQAQPLPVNDLENTVRRLRMPRLEWDRSHIEKSIQVLERRLHQQDIDDNPLAGGEHPLGRHGTEMVRLAGLRRLLARMDRGEDLNPPCRLQGIRIGPVRLLGAPFELYQATRRAIEARLPDGPVMHVSLANGAEGYAPDPESYTGNPYAAEFVTLMGGQLPFPCLHERLVRELTAFFAR